MKSSDIKFGKAVSFLLGIFLAALAGCQGAQVAGTGSGSNTGTGSQASPPPVASPSGTNPSSQPSTIPTSTPAPSLIPSANPSPASGLIDRMGIPAINTILIGFNGFTKSRGSVDSAGNEAREKYNSETPATDVASYRAEFASTIAQAFSRNQGDANNIAAILTPDVLTIDTTKPTLFPNGRFLNDDVVDIELKLLTGNINATDNVNNNDASFSITFPYLAKPF